jgi:hypothetical protein
MFLVSWLSDSKRVGTSRDGFVAITDFNGDVVAEFGDRGAERYQYSSNKNPIHWTKGELRDQFGEFMPHQKHLDGSEEFGFGERGSFSPDGKWYGPLEDRKGAFFLGPEGQRLPITFPNKFSRWSGRPMWSADGRYIQLTGDNSWLIIDVQTRKSTQIENVSTDACGPAECRANPWSSDGARLVFVRDGQIWMSDAQGKGAKQLTFDNTRKASPIFSRDGRSVAYLTWQPDDRKHYTRLGPTNLWVIDLETTLATRVTAPAPGRINSFDWLDDRTLIFDRFERKKDSFVPRSSLRRLSL